MVHALQRLMATGMMGKRLQKGHLGGDCQTPTPAYPGDIKERGNQGLGKGRQSTQWCGGGASQEMGCRCGGGWELQ